MIVLLDAGFSGAGPRSTAAQGARPPAAGAPFESAGGKIAVLAAAAPDQAAGADAEKGHGLFTAELFAGLNGGALDASGRLTLQSLFDFVKTRVADDARRAGAAQVPQFEPGASAADAALLRAR